MGERKQAERGHGRCQEEAGKSALPAPASSWPAAGGVRRGCRFCSHPRSRSRHFLPGATFQAARVLAWEYSVFICASPMAEGRRREDEEEELRERRELGGPRRARGRVLSCYFAAGEGYAEREGYTGPGPRAVLLGAARVLLWTATALSAAQMGPAPLGGFSHPHHHWLAEPEAIHPGLYLRGPRSQTTNFPCTRNPGALA